MSLLVGTDSYITIEEAEQYMEQFYTATDALRVSWSVLSDADKEVYLRKAFRCIEGLPLRGCKRLLTQTTMFPRSDSLTVPQRVKYAQVELAIASMQLDSGEGLSEDMRERRQLQLQGVTSIKIGKMSEQYSLGTTRQQGDFTLALSEPAQAYLREWLGGGYHIQRHLK